METAQRRQTISKLSRIPGYAGGGFLDKLKGVFGGGSAPPPPPPPKDPPPEPVATDIWSQTRKRRETEAGLAGGSKVKPGMAKEAMAAMPSMDGKKKSNSGGMLKGPGTPTSDSIPAEVVDTGEPIKVATGERIVSKKQDAFLQQLAQEKGFPSVDAMLEAGTGEPVGPTIRYDEGKRGASTGASAADLEREKLVAQIPTGGVPGAGPTAPSPQATPGAYDDTKSVARTALNDVRFAINSGNAGRAINNAVRGMAATQVSGLVDTAGAVSGALKPVGNFISNVATGEDMAPAQTAVQPATAPVEREIASAAAPVASPQPAKPATSFQPSKSVYGEGQASSRMAGVDVGGGVTRVNEPGKAPLFTNVPAGGAPVAADPAAMMTAKAERDALTQRDIALGNQMQADRESRDAANFASGQNQQAVEQTIANKVDNERARQRAETTLSSIVNNDGTRAQKAAAAQTLAALDRQDEGAQRDLSAAQRLATTDQTTRRGQDITANGQAVQGEALRANQKLTQAQFGIQQSQESRSAAKDAREAKQQDRLQAAYDAYEKDPSEDNAAKVRVLTGKEKAQAPDLFDKIQTGVDPITNVPIYSLYNKRTGEMSGQQAKPQGQYETGKVYTDAKGNRAKWDGKAFVPA